MTLKEIHRVLSDASRLVVSLYPLQAPVASDTAYAIGEAAGVLSKAKALLGRDIDQSHTETNDAT